jgi:hypothetical protein
VAPSRGNVEDERRLSSRGHESRLEGRVCGPVAEQFPRLIRAMRRRGWATGTTSGVRGHGVGVGYNRGRRQAGADRPGRDGEISGALRARMSGWEAERAPHLCVDAYGPLLRSSVYIYISNMDNRSFSIHENPKVLDL